MPSRLVRFGRKRPAIATKQKPPVEPAIGFAPVDFSGLAPELAKALLPIIARLDVIERQNRNMMRQLLLPDTSEWLGQPTLIQDAKPGPFVFTHGELCREDSFRQPYFSYWTSRIQAHLGFHRKLWEFVFICQVLFERGQLQQGRRGLGFGVGNEPLSALFASFGCSIVGTDVPVSEAVAAGWAAGAQHAAGKQALARPDLCDPQVFDASVSFRDVDMNHVPSDLDGFDFCWSACALEHLGSIDLGMAFIERSVETLKPGGVAVHTTEFNLTSDYDTLDNAGTVLFRKRDFEELTRRLAAKGHEVAPMNLDPGYGSVDRFIDAPPYLENPHLKVALEGYATTSVGFIVRRKP